MSQGLLRFKSLAERLKIPSIAAWTPGFQDAGHRFGFFLQLVYP